MGSDDLFHKRKARKASSLKRDRARRSPYDTALIVCEGGKTEPNYFKSLRDDLKLNTANVEITGDTGGSAPDNVVEHGLRYYGEYDKVFCVFDKDSHPTYQQAVDRVKCTKKKKDHTIEVITSVPCFEYWVLLHFQHTTRHFDGTTGSICEKVIKDLKLFLPNYQKGDAGLYQEIKPYLSKAIKRADLVLQHCKTGGTDHPSTLVHKLVLYLQRLKNSK